MGDGYKSGLSPLARGTLSLYRLNRFLARFIPAGAGNTEILSVSPIIALVYPRWRGEHLYRDAGLGVTAGLSPLARGTRIALINFDCLSRFIPAGAGNTLTISYCFIINLSAKNNLPTFLQQIDVFKEP